MLKTKFQHLTISALTNFIFIQGMIIRIAQFSTDNLGLIPTLHKGVEDHLNLIGDIYSFSESLVKGFLLYGLGTILTSSFRRIKIISVAISRFLSITTWSLINMSLIAVYIYCSIASVPLSLSALIMLEEPGILTDMGISIFEWSALIFIFLTVMAMEGGVVYLDKKRAGLAGGRTSSMPATLAIGFIITTTLHITLTTFFSRRKTEIRAPIFSEGSMEMIRRQFVPPRRSGKDITLKEWIDDLPKKTLLHVKRPMSVLIIGTESLRADMLNPDNMPKTWEFLKRNEAWISPNHYSTGNMTKTGLWGLLSGLTATSWTIYGEHPKSEDFLFLLKALGFTNSVFSSVEFPFKNIQRSVLNNYVDHVNLVGGKKPDIHSQFFFDVDINRFDSWMTRQYIEQIETRPKKLYFDFIFYHSTHYPYYYSASSEQYTPTISKRFILFRIKPSHREKLMNRYKNSVRFIDSQIEKILRAMKKSRRLQDTVVVITSDHGQEFYENGLLFHGTGLTDEQIKVPLAILSPQKFNSAYTITSHSDLVPTLIDILKVTPDISPFFSGKSLSRFEPNNNSAVAINSPKSDVNDFLLRKDDQILFFKK